MSEYTDNGRIIRETGIISSDKYYAPNGKSICEAMRLAVENEARRKAEIMGITDFVVWKRWTHGCVRALEYPMSLLGPNAPKIETVDDVFATEWRDVGYAEYQFVIRELLPNA